MTQALAVDLAYDPLAIDERFIPQRVDLTVQDGARKRDIPIRVYLPAARGPAPVVLFSHGLGGSREGNAYLGNHWSARGYVVVFLQHPGSDTAEWKDKPLGQRMAAMQEAAGASNYLLRLAVFPALPPGGKYELVLDGTEHSAFGDTPLPGDTEKRNPNPHRAILALSTAFWDTYLRDQALAKTWLDGSGPRSILEKDDRWQMK